VAREKLYDLLRQAAARVNPPATPEEVLDALYDDYREFRRMKRQQEWPKLQGWSLVSSPAVLWSIDPLSVFCFLLSAFETSVVRWSSPQRFAFLRPVLAKNLAPIRLSA
jgi:hypothetical protein